MVLPYTRKMNYFYIRNKKVHQLIPSQGKFEVSNGAFARVIVLMFIGRLH